MGHQVEVSQIGAVADDARELHDEPRVRQVAPLRQVREQQVVAHREDHPLHALTGSGELVQLVRDLAAEAAGATTPMAAT